jgi:hypothetical protein
LLHGPARPVAPTAATLTSAVLTFAEHVAERLGVQEQPEVGHGWLPDAAGWLLPGGPGHGAFGHQVIVHTIGNGGVLHLQPSDRLRAVSLARGALAQRCTSRPELRPGAVRLIPPGRAVTLADLSGNGALAVEVVL